MNRIEINNLNPKSGNNPDKIVFNNYDYKKVAAIIHAIHHKLRQEIINLVEKNPNIIVSDIYKKLRVEQSTCSQHLAILRRVGVLKTKRLGKNVMYDVNFKRVQEINQFVKQILNSSRENDFFEQ